MKQISGYIRVTCAILFTLIMAIVAIIAIPFDSRGHWYHRVSRSWSRILLIICGLRLSTEGTERLSPGQTYIYVSNHASLLDIPIIVTGIPDQIRIVYKKELEKIPLFGWGLKWGSYIGIDRGKSADAKKSLDEAIRKIRKGASVLLYAEGTRTLDGKLQPFKRGAFNLAVSAGIPVVPLTINGTFAIMPKGSLAIHPRPVRLTFEEPIHVGPEQGKEAELRLMEKVHAAIAKHYVDQ
jgi:1-acyl-sn-glycerol-3-phosphate acyltransferase